MTVAVAVERQSDHNTVVIVLPITHSPPTDPASGVEIPALIKHHLGLDHQRSWVIVSEGNEFNWPGYDLRKIVGTDRYDYGFLPPKFFNKILKSFLAWHRAKRLQMAPRD